MRPGLILKDAPQNRLKTKISPKFGQPTIEPKWKPTAGTEEKNILSRAGVTVTEDRTPEDPVDTIHGVSGIS
jgi:hypothetical protein